jgi:hypothetical protein
MAHTHNDAQNTNDAGQTTGEDDGNDKKNAQDTSDDVSWVWYVFFTHLLLF